MRPYTQTLNHGSHTLEEFLRAPKNATAQVRLEAVDTLDGRDVLEVEDCLAAIAQIDEVPGIQNPASLHVCFNPPFER